MNQFIRFTFFIAYPVSLKYATLWKWNGLQMLILMYINWFDYILWAQTQYNTTALTIFKC